MTQRHKTETADAENISRRTFAFYINKKVDHIIHSYHILSIITLLFEELLQDLKKKKEIKVFNLGSLFIEETKPRWYYDLFKKEKRFSSTNNIIRFVLCEKLNKIIQDNTDMEKTFNLLK